MGAVTAKTLNTIKYVDKIVQFEVCRQGCCITETDTTVPAIAMHSDPCLFGSILPDSNNDKRRKSGLVQQLHIQGSKVALVISYVIKMSIKRFNIA